MTLNAEEGYRYEHGRQFYNSKSVSYVLPSDEEEAKRVAKQHLMLKAGFGGNFDAPVHESLENGIIVLDAGCGPAAWTTEMATMYPHSTFHGVDIAPRCSMTPPSNCHFHTRNLVEGAPFSDAYFDFIHQRLLVLALLETAWDTVLEQHMRMLRPGGWIELLEVSFLVIENAGPKTTLLMHAVYKIGASKGLHMDIPFELEERLKKAGAVNTSIRAAPTPVNHGGEIGDLCWDDFLEAFTSMHALVVQAHPELQDMDVYKKHLNECAEECKENKTNLLWYRCYGQKPVAPI